MMRFIVISVVFFSLLLTAATADVSFVDSEATLDVDFEAFDQEDQENITATASVQLRNNDPAAGVTRTISIMGLPSGYAAANQTVTLAANETQAISIQVTVPHEDHDSQTIATITVVEEPAVTAALVQEQASMLVFDKIEIDYYDEDNEKQNEDFDDIEADANFDLDNNVRLGTEIALTFEVKNRFPNKDYRDSDLNNVEVQIDADDSDIFPRGFDDSYEFQDLEAKEKASETVRFVIPHDIDAGDYQLEFTLTGEDDNDVTYEIVATIDLEIERVDDDVRITRAVISPSTVTTCRASSYTLDVELQNIGTDDQGEVGLAILNADLGIDENVPPFRLEEFDESDDTWRRTFNYNIDEDMEAGTYTVELRAFINRDGLIDDATVDLIVEGCAVRPPQVITTTLDTQPSAAEGEEDAVLTVNAAAAQSGARQPTGAATSFPVISTTELAYSSDDLLLGLIVVAGVLLLAMIALLVAILVKK